MPLSRPELKALADLLAPAFSLLVPAHLRADMRWEKPGAEQVFDWLEKLNDAQLLAVLDILGDNELARALRVRLTPVAAPAVNAPAPHVILTGLPVVDRVEIWSRLQSLHTGRPRILAIRGERGTGKTYTKWLVLEFCSRLGAPHVALQPVDLEGVFTLESIASDLLASLGAPGVLKPFEEAHSTAKAWARSVSRQVFQYLSARGAARWLVFDHFERTTRSEAAIVFFLQLAEQVALSFRSPDGPRLVLIDHGIDVPPAARGVSVEEEVRMPNSTDIATFVGACRPAWSLEERQRESNRIQAALKADSYMDDLDEAVRPLLVPA
jgi:hypothetical protein